jgi:hypothetical protein
MTINFKNIEDMNAFIANGLPNFDTNEIDSLFDAIQSKARNEEQTRSIAAFSRVCLEY